LPVYGLAERLDVGDVGLSKLVTCGIVSQLRARLPPEIFWMRDSGSRVTGRIS